MEQTINEVNGLPWYSYDGQNRDVIISSRVRLARNLANFPFPAQFRGDDKERVQAIVFDAFSQLDNAAGFHAIESASLSENSRQILEERGVIKPSAEKKACRLPSESGIVMSADGKICCPVNCSDHLHIARFASGLDFRSSFEECRKIDAQLQKKLQFAASYDFGYLTAAMRNAGSGMKLSARIHLPGTVRFGKLSVILDYLKQKNCSVMPAFPSISQGSAAGNFFLISTNSAQNGSEIDQIAEMESICKYIAECECKILKDFADNKSTLIRNSVIRAYSIAKFSMLVSLREAVDIISDIKLGLQLHLLSGIDINALCSLLYRIQDGHLSYLMNNGSFDFEKDVLCDGRMKIDRLRAITIQESFEKISLGNL